MKKELISSLASWKSASLLALVALVAAVAFSGVLTNSQKADAATIDLPVADAAATAAPGDTVTIVVANPFARVTITGKAADVDASFVSGGAQMVACGDGAACDIDDSDASTAGKQNVEDSVTVALKIADDSGEGHILLDIDGIGGAATDSIKVINVSKAGLVGSLALKTDAATDKTVMATAGVSNLTATVKNASTPAAGLAGQTVSVTTTHGTVGCGTGAGTATAGSSQTCSAATDAAGVVDILLTGGGVEGTATVTARLGTRTATATVTLFGTAKKLSAEPMQGSVEIGGKVFIVLTVTDGADNPVANLEIAPVSSKEVVGPAKDAVLVTTSQDATADDDADGKGYNVDFIHPTDPTKNIPACGDDKDPATDTGATPPTTETFATNGTNAAGKCVVQVNTQKAAGTTKATTRGEHTLNFQVSATVKASATIEVAGTPASITTDAPESVDPGSVTTITVSVWDDTEVLVGITSVKTRKVDGGGLIEDAGDGGSEMTNNGQSKFTFIAPSNAGSSEILITAGTVNHRVAITIGEPAPEGPAPTWNKPLASGTHNLVWNGADGADPADAGDNIVAIWQWTGSGWNGYFAEAGDVGLANTLTELSNGEAYWVVVR